MDTAIFQDRKIRRLQRKCDFAAALVYIELLCVIYREGYYIKWDEDFTFDLADEMHQDEDYVRNVVEACLEVGLLSREMFDKHHILTSRGIQKQYQAVCEKSKRKSRVQAYSLLVPSEEMQGNEQSNDINSERMPILSEEIESDRQCEAIPSEDMQQSKVKESKVKKSKVNSFSSSSSPSPEVEYVPSEEEQEKEEFLSHMFFKDWKDPGKELEKFIAFNNVGGRKWEKMSHGERAAALMLWRQEPAQSPRLGKFLPLWRKVYNILVELNAPFSIRMDALSDGIAYRIRQNKLILTCSERLAHFIDRRMDIFKQAFVKFLRDGGYNEQSFIYEFIPSWTPQNKQS